MPLLVDGNNLLYAARQVAGFGGIEPHQLCRLLARWGRHQRTEVAVVFDGPSPGQVLTRQMRALGVDVRFSGTRTADDVVVEIVEGARAPGRYTVVSSDHAIQHAARYRRAAAVNAEDFIRDVLSPADDDEPAPASEPPEKPHDPSPDEADEWLRRFGHDPAQPLDDTDLML